MDPIFQPILCSSLCTFWPLARWTFTLFNPLACGRHSSYFLLKITIPEICFWRLYSCSIEVESSFLEVCLQKLLRSHRCWIYLALVGSIINYCSAMPRHPHIVSIQLLLSSLLPNAIWFLLADHNPFPARWEQVEGAGEGGRDKVWDGEGMFSQLAKW